MASTYRWICAIGLLWTLTPIRAATYYVATNGNNSNNGSQESPWLTVSYAASKVSAGDVVRVQSGTYNERVSIRTSGTSSAWLNFVGDGLPTVRGFDLSSVNYVRTIGFEITHTNTGTYPYTRGVFLTGRNDHVQIIDNYVHNTEGEGIMFQYGSINTFCVVRGNTIASVGIIPGVISNSFHAAIQGSVTSTPGAQLDSHNLFEYNILTNISDGIWSTGTNAIVRNNMYRWFDESHYTNAPDAQHADFVQPGGMYNTAVKDQVYEANFIGDNDYLNSHVMLFNDQGGNGFSNILVRANVAFGIGSCGVLAGCVDKVSCYNNTWFDFGRTHNSTNGSGSAYIFYRPGGYPAGDYSTDNLVANCIMAVMPDYNYSPISNNADTNNTINKVANLGWAIPRNDSSFWVKNDPLFVDTNGLSFHLRSSSPAESAGTNILWITSPGASGTQFNVNDGQLLCDGYGIVQGDTITVNGTTTHITDIVGDTVTVADSVAWTNGQPVWWGRQEGCDIGALPYGSTDLTAARLTRNGSTYTVRVTGDARGVWFYTNGIPAQWVTASPYSTTISDGSTVTAKAYALYAQANPVVPATSNSGSLATPPATLNGGFTVSGNGEQFGVTATSGPAPLSISYYSTTSSTTWTFGDGTSASGASGTHTFTTAGSYTVRVYVDGSSRGAFGISAK